MKMSRLTEIDEFGNADIIGMEDETWQMGLSFNDMNKVTLALNRLHRLEKLYEQHKQPDPDTGLVPCGCGGKAHIINSSSYIRRLYVECDRCDIMLGVEATEDGALQGTYHCDDQIIKDWNHAMGMLEVEG
jgi:hypothetical protein